MTRLLLTGTLFFALLCGTARAQTCYTISVLPLDLALGDSVRSLNNAGQVMGNNHIWQNGRLTLLETPPAGAAYAHTISDNGDVCGSYNNGAEVRSFYTSGDTTVDLGGLDGQRRNGRPGMYSIAFSVNNRGQVVGFSRNHDGHQHAFLWQNGTLTDLGTLNGITSLATGINDKGQIAGQSFIGNRYQHAFMWQNGQMRDLGCLPGETYSRADTINANGDILGSSGSHAVTWHNGTIVDLGGDLQGNGFNNQGQVVGTAGNGLNGTPYAALWQNGTVYDLHTLIPTGTTWKLEKAVSINDGGQIVGVGRVGGRFRTFLLTPIVLP